MNNLKEAISNTVQAVLDGNISALEAKIEMKSLEAHLKQCMEVIEADVLDEAKKYNKTVFHGYMVEVRSAAGRWDFAGIPEWENVRNDLKTIEERAKAAAKAYEKGIRSVNEDAEMITPAKYTAGKETVFLTAKNK